MPSKSLTQSPQTASDTNLEVTKPTKPSEVTSEVTFVNVSSSGHLGERRKFSLIARAARRLRSTGKTTKEVTNVLPVACRTSTRPSLGGCNDPSRGRSPDE